MSPKEVCDGSPDLLGRKGGQPGRRLARDLGGSRPAVGCSVDDRSPGVHRLILGTALARVCDELLQAERPSMALHPGPGTPSSLALLSGTFDPLTVGHAALADAALRHADALMLVVSVRPLAKEGELVPPLLPLAERLAILERFRESRPGVLIGLCSHGLLAEQAYAARERFPDARLLLVMGSDKALQVLDPRWYLGRDDVLEDLFREARVLYAERAGEEGRVEDELRRQENRRWRDRFERVDLPSELAGVSSRRVRDLLRRGEDVGQLVPAGTEDVLFGAP